MRPISPSSLATFGQCALSYRLRYVDQAHSVPGARALYGRVVHAAVEAWVIDATQDLAQLVRDAWRDAGAKDYAVREFVRQYERLTAQSQALEDEIRAARPTIKEPRRTKEWKESAVAEASYQLMREVTLLQEESYYRFSPSEPLPALYDRSVREAGPYAAARAHLPRPVVTEFRFDVTWSGFRLNGMIDRILPVVDQDTGEIAGYAVVDTKTGEDNGVAHKHLNQLTMYEIAVGQMIREGRLGEYEGLRPELPRFQVIDWWGSGGWTAFQVGPRDRRRLLGELESMKRAVEADAFVPASRSKACDFCDLFAACEAYHSPERIDWVERLLAPVTDTPPATLVA